MLASLGTEAFDLGVGYGRKCLIRRARHHENTVHTKRVDVNNYFVQTLSARTAEANRARCVPTQTAEIRRASPRAREFLQ